MKAKKTSPVLRVAVVQFDYHPTAVLHFPLMEEPTLLAEGENGITSLHIKHLGFENQLNELRNEIANQYKQFTSNKILDIILKIDEFNVNLIVFPEYSISSNNLEEIDSMAHENLIVIAASCTITPNNIGELNRLGLNVSEKDVGISICPVRIKKGKWERVDKLSKSKWESSLKKGNTWSPISFNDTAGNEWTFAIFHCVDFINENEDAIIKAVPRNIWSKVDFAVVPSYTPVVRDFYQRAKSIAERAGIPILYSNVASSGGSYIHCHFSESNTLIDKNSTKPLKPGDEAIIIIDMIHGRENQFERKPSPLPVPQTSNFVNILPLLYRETNNVFCDLSDKIRKVVGEERKRILANNSKDDLTKLTSSPQTTEILKNKIYALLYAMSWQDSDFIDNCLQYIPCNTANASLNELRFILLYKSQKFLANILNDVQIKGNELESVTDILNLYRRNIDAIRPHIRQEILNKYEITTLQTLSDDNEEKIFTSVFLLRLRTAQTHHEALEKQIQLISTIAYQGNENIALNLRYISTPNPGGNLKELFIDIIGAAKSESRESSQIIADNFRRDLMNLMRITLQDVYAFEVKELENDSLLPLTEPIKFNYIAELFRQVEFGTQPYIDKASSPIIHHLEGSSSMARILDMLQSSPFACMISIHLQPCKLSDTEETFFNTYYKVDAFRSKTDEAAMFYVGAAGNRNPELRIPNAVTMKRMLGDNKGLTPNLLLRIFIASDVPIPGLLINTIGSEIWGNDTYQINEYKHELPNYTEALKTLQIVWPNNIITGSSSPKTLERIPFLFDVYEACRQFRLPLAGHSSAVGTLFKVLPSPAAALPNDGIELGLGFHSSAQRPIVVRLSERERTKHTYVVGKTGTGKSTLLARMIEQDIEMGKGVCVIDPHGDLIESILLKIPDNRLEDVVLFDPSTTEMPIGLNLLEYNPEVPHHKDFIVQETISIMRKLSYFEHFGPVFEHNLRNLVLTVIDESWGGKGTLVEVPFLLTDEKLRKAVIPKLKDEFAIDYWNQYSSLTNSFISDQLFYVVSKFDTFTTDRMMRNIIGQSHSTINIAEIVNNQKILLVKLPSAVIGEINASLLGMIIISKLRWAGMARASVTPNLRKDYYIYVDEFQNFATSGFESIFAEARKYGISLTVAHQHIGQLSGFNISTGSNEDRVSKAIFGNAGTIITFRVGNSDAEFFAKEMGAPVDPEDLVNIKNYYAIAKTIIDGEVYPPFTIKTKLSSKPDNPNASDIIKKNSLNKYGRLKSTVENEIKERREQLKEIKST